MESKIWDYRTQKLRAKNQRQKIISSWGGKCTECGETDITKLDFHHVDPYTKVHNVGEMFGRASIETICEEAEKCELLCRSCHVKETWKTGDRPKAKHGTRSMYINQKCRCDDCFEANSEYLAEYRRTHKK